MDYEKKLSELMTVNESIFALTAENRGPLINIENAFPDRFLDVGICEQTMVGIAAGLAKVCGVIPVVHAMAAFLTMRAYEFIRTDVGIHRLPVKIVGTSAGIYSEHNGPTHQSVEDIALMRSIPGMHIFVPADLDDMIRGMERVICSDETWYVRYNCSVGNVRHQDFAVGESELFGEYGEVAILTYGAMFVNALKLSQLFLNNGIASCVLNMRSLSPIDEEKILDVVRKSKKTLILEDHLEFGGLYTIVAEILTRNKVTADIEIFCFQSYFNAGNSDDVLKRYGLSSERMFEVVCCDRE
jgi:transketolase